MKAFSKIIAPYLRDKKPRSTGLTMVLDKGLGLSMAKDLVNIGSEYIDIIKLGWATPCLMKKSLVKEKVKIFRQAGISVGNGGTLLEIAYHRGELDEFFKEAKELGFDVIEVSNGIVPMPSKDKIEIIKRAKSEGFIVVSEVGRKDPLEDKKLSIEQRIDEALMDLGAGSFQVIIEAREAGKGLGIYNEKGEVNIETTKRLVEKIGIQHIMFEAPEKSQQVFLILLLGKDVNLGNIKPEDVIPLETLRQGIRGDTFGKV